MAIESLEDTSALDRLVRDAYNCDFPERLVDEKRENSTEDMNFMRQVQQSIIKDSGHYYVNLPFRNKDPKLPNNREMAHKRLFSLKRRLSTDASYKNEYTTTIQSLIDNDYAEMVPEMQLDRNDGHVWYIPHHGVSNPNKDKLRVVFDCAATYSGTSLNQHLLQ